MHTDFVHQCIFSCLSCQFLVKALQILGWVILAFGEWENLRSGGHHAANSATRDWSPGASHIKYPIRLTSQVRVWETCTNQCIDITGKVRLRNRSRCSVCDVLETATARKTMFWFFSEKGCRWGGVTSHCRCSLLSARLASKNDPGLPADSVVGRQLKAPNTPLPGWNGVSTYTPRASPHKIVQNMMPVVKI